VATPLAGSDRDAGVRIFRSTGKNSGALLALAFRTGGAGVFLRPVLERARKVRRLRALDPTDGSFLRVARGLGGGAVWRRGRVGRPLAVGTRDARDRDCGMEF